MKLSELIPCIDATVLVQGNEDAEITSGYTCDLLSWVMAHGAPGMAWVTVQTHLNVIAVAVLSEMACVILPESIEMEQESLDKARTEGMTVLSSPLTAYEICGLSGIISQMPPFVNNVSFACASSSGDSKQNSENALSRTCAAITVSQFSAVQYAPDRRK